MRLCRRHPDASANIRAGRLSWIEDDTNAGSLSAGAIGLACRAPSLPPGRSESTASDDLRNKV